MWNHLLCDDCYEIEEPGREPIRLLEEVGDCCRCGDYTESGIMYRNNPEAYGCMGEHD